MTDPSPDTTDVLRNTTPSSDTTVDVPEAAVRLGISEEAVRARIRRGTLAAEKVGALWRLHLDDDTSRDTTQHPPSRHTTQQHASHDTTVRDATSDALIAHLEGEVGYLRDQLATTISQLAAERERADILQREALERLAALPAGEAPVAPEHAETVAQDAEDHTLAPAPDTGLWDRLRRWWTGT